MEYLVHSLRYTMSGRRLEAVELPEAPSQRKSAGHIVLVEHLCATALGQIVLVEHCGALVHRSTWSNRTFVALWRTYCGAQV